MKPRRVVPVNTPLLSGNEKKYLMQCVDTGWISSEGEFVKIFESRFSDYIGMKYGIAVSSGSAALDIVVQALDLSKGDEVIMPTFTIISPALSVCRAGGTPVLVDCDARTWNMDVGQVEAKITRRTRAICAVHIYGLPVDMDPLIALCDKYGLQLIEDAAEVHGQTYRKRKCGSFGRASIFSFYSNKHITTGEGGMILTNDPKLDERCRKLRNLAFEPGRRFVHEELGWNYRMTNMQAALGIAQHEQIEKHLRRKIEIGQMYNSGLKGIPGYQFPLERTVYAENLYWVYAMVADSEERCTGMMAHLAQANIGTRPFFWCMHEQPVFRKRGLFGDEKFPQAEMIARNGFYLPSGLGLSDDDIHYVIETFKSIAS